MGQSDKKQEDFWFTLLRRENERALWHPELELLFVLKGAGRVCLAQNGPVYRINAVSYTHLTLPTTSRV